MTRKGVERMDRNHQAMEAEQKREGAHWSFGDKGEAEDDDLRGQLRRQWTGHHPLSGQPNNWGAEACEMIGAGIELDDPALLALLQRMLKYDIDMNIGSPRIAVPKSRVLYVMTDPTGLLEEGQVFIQLSEVSPETRLRRTSPSIICYSLGRPNRRAQQVTSNAHPLRPCPCLEAPVHPAHRHSEG
jgi:hypothetical protein